MANLNKFAFLLFVLSTFLLFPIGIKPPSNHRKVGKANNISSREQLSIVEDAGKLKINYFHKDKYRKLQDISDNCHCQGNCDYGMCDGNCIDGYTGGLGEPCYCGDGKYEKNDECINCHCNGNCDVGGLCDGSCIDGYTGGGGEICSCEDGKYERDDECVLQFQNRLK